jgi:hypothetical protein
MSQANSHSISPTALSKRKLPANLTWRLPGDIAGLAIAFDALIRAAEAVSVIAHQPRAKYSVPLDPWWGDLLNLADIAAEKLSDLEPRDSTEVDIKMATQLKWHAACGDPEPILQVVAEAAAARTRLSHWYVSGAVPFGRAGERRSPNFKAQDA